jgi:Na+-driven multidrug efflux pump
MLNLPFFFLRMFWSNFLSNDSAPKAGKNASLIAVLVNILLDLLLISGLGMGVKGASIATSIAILMANLYLFNYISKHKGHFGFQHFRFTLRLKEWRQLLNLGLPSFASELSFSTGLLLISHSVVPYGALAVSAFGLINYISFIFIRMLTAAMLAVLPIISFNIGAQNHHRVLEALRFSSIFTVVLGAIISLLAFIIPPWLMDLFAGHESLAFKQLVSSSLALYFILFLTAGPNYILSAYFQSIGKAAISMVINILKGVVLIWLLLMLLPGYLNMGLDGVWLSRSLAELFTLVLIGLYTFYRKGMYYSKTAIIPNSLPIENKDIEQSSD